MASQTKKPPPKKHVHVLPYGVDSPRFSYRDHMSLAVSYEKNKPSYSHQDNWVRDPNEHIYIPGAVYCDLMEELGSRWFSRPCANRLMLDICPGDVIVCKSPEMMFANRADAEETLAVLQEHGVEVRFIAPDCAIADEFEKNVSLYVRSAGWRDKKRVSEYFLPRIIGWRCSDDLLHWREHPGEQAVATAIAAWQDHHDDEPFTEVAARFALSKWIEKQSAREAFANWFEAFPIAARLGFPKVSSEILTRELRWRKSYSRLFNSIPRNGPFHEGLKLLATDGRYYSAQELNSYIHSKGFEFDFRQSWLDLVPIKKAHATPSDLVVWDDLLDKYCITKGGRDVLAFYERIEALCAMKGVSPSAPSSGSASPQPSPEASEVASETSAPSQPVPGPS